MAGDTRPDAESTDARRSRSVARRLGVTHRHAAGTTVVAAVLALVCGFYASWLLADFGLRLPALVVVVLVCGVVFYARPTRTGVLAAGLYAIAALVALTPVMLDLGFVLAADSYGITDPWPFVLSLADLLFLVVFVLLALLLAGAAFVVGRRGG